ncbi:MAG: RNA-binding protein [Deltaproteobacteria bacterium]|nr:RNA-binding protein [Deltaproteobacteria bacterium]
MKNKLFFGGLAWATGEDSLRDAVSQYGELEEVRIITDRDTGRSRGFGFVTFVDEEAAAKCKEEMDGVAIDGRNVRVDYPRERENRGGGGGGGGGYNSNRSW